MEIFFSYKCTANLPLNLTFTKFWKPVKIWQSYCKENGGILFWNTVYYVDKGRFWCYSIHLHKTAHFNNSNSYNSQFYLHMHASTADMNSNILKCHHRC